MSFVTSNYLNIEGKDSIVVEYTLEDNSINTKFSTPTKELNLIIIKAIIIALGDLEELNVDDYETKVNEVIDNLFNDDYMHHIFSITCSYTNYTDVDNNYEISISLKNKSLVI